MLKRNGAYKPPSRSQLYSRVLVASLHLSEQESKTSQLHGKAVLTQAVMSLSSINAANTQGHVTQALENWDSCINCRGYSCNLRGEAFLHGRRRKTAAAPRTRQEARGEEIPLQNHRARSVSSVNEPVGKASKQARQNVRVHDSGLRSDGLNS
eukprot:COSAG02_NODE_2596_length_8456_cov_23.592078_3_plen_153_part_00